MMIPQQHEHLRGALSRFAGRMAASVAANANLTAEQLRLPLRRPPTASRPAPRASRPAPPQSRQFLRQMSTAVLRDQRLTPSARTLAGLIVALVGRAVHVDLTRGYLQARLGVSERTTARMLAQLRAYGYIATRWTIGAYGETTGLRVELLDALLPFWETDQPVVVEEGVTKASGLEDSKNQKIPKMPPAGYPVLAYPRYRRPKAA